MWTTHSVFVTSGDDQVIRTESGWARRPRKQSSQEWLDLRPSLSCRTPALGKQKVWQGDTSGRTKPTVDMKTKVAFQYNLFILKHNFCFHVNDRFGPTWCVTLYRLPEGTPVEVGLERNQFFNGFLHSAGSATGWTIMSLTWVGLTLVELEKTANYYKSIGELQLFQGADQ